MDVAWGFQGRLISPDLGIPAYLRITIGDTAILSRSPTGIANRTEKLGLLTHPKPINDQNEAEEAKEHDIQLLEARENPSVALQATEQPLHFVAPLVHFLVVLPRIDPIGLGGTTGTKPRSSANWRVSLPS